MNFENIVATTMREGGGTFDRSGGQVSRDTGFAVGAHIGTYASVSAENPDLIASIIRVMLADYPDIDYFGTWLNGNMVYVDPVIITPNEGDAIAIAFANQQMAYYDFARNEAIPTPFMSNEQAEDSFFDEMIDYGGEG